MVQPTTGRARFDADVGASLQDDLIGSNAADLLARKYTLASGEIVTRGMLIGLIDIGGEVVWSASANGDGSEAPYGICAEDADATLGSVEVMVFVRGSFNEREVERLLGASGHTIASVREGLRDKGIYLEKPVRRYPE